MTGEGGTVSTHQKGVQVRSTGVRRPPHGQLLPSDPTPRECFNGPRVSGTLHITIAPCSVPAGQRGRHKGDPELRWVHQLQHTDRATSPHCVKCGDGHVEKAPSSHDPTGRGTQLQHSLIGAPHRHRCHVPLLSISLPARSQPARSLPGTLAACSQLPRSLPARYLPTSPAARTRLARVPLESCKLFSLNDCLGLKTLGSKVWDRGPSRFSQAPSSKSHLL